MIDWLTATLPLRHPREINNGSVMCLSSDGEVVWRSPKAASVVGSHSAKVQIRTSPIFGHSHINFSGNPAKFLQGQNVFGSSNLRGLALGVTDRIAEMLQIHRFAEDRANVAAGEFDITMVDCTESWSLPSRGHVRAALKVIEANGRLSRRVGRSAYDGGTVTFGKHSRRWACKLYAKGDEIEAPHHWLPSELANLDEITALADALLRVEFRFHSMHLRRLGLRRASSWDETTCSSLHSTHLERLHISGDIDMDNNELLGLTPACRMAYFAWKAGEDLRKSLSRASFYRYRSQLLKLGVDIATIQARASSNVVPLRVVLQAKPFEVPAWAKNSPAYFDADRYVA